MVLYCKDREYSQVNALVCLYLCRKSSKLKCKEYADNYDKLIELNVDEHYKEKYGQPELPPPKKPKIKQEKVAKAKKKAVPAKSVIPKKPKKEVEAPEVKPKRKRRTKAEMEEARKNEATKTKRAKKGGKV